MKPTIPALAALVVWALIVAGFTVAAVWFAQHDYATAAIALGLFVGFAEVFRELAEIREALKSKERP